MRCLVLAYVVVCLGCGSNPAINDAAVREIQAATMEKDVGADDVLWPVVIEMPVKVLPQNSTQCLRPTLKYHGPHFKPAIVVRTNPESLEAFQAKQSPMPVGMVVIKEKHEEEDASDAANEFGAMIKREPGYDPEHGDWEYVYGSISPGVTLERGKLANCIECHEAYAKDRDYLFRSYLPDKGDLAQARSGR